MAELANTEGYDEVQCIPEQSWAEQQRDGILGCGTSISYIYFITFMIAISMMIMNLFVAVVIEGFSASTQENSGVVTSVHFADLIEKWAVYDPNATGFITPKDLAFLVHEIYPPLGKKKEIKNKDENILADQDIKQNRGGMLDISMKYIQHEKRKKMILPQKEVMSTLIHIGVPVYRNQKVHFKDVCIRLTKLAIHEGTESKMFDRIGDDQEKRLEKEWKKKHGVLKKQEQHIKIDTGIFWAGEFIAKVTKNSILKRSRARAKQEEEEEEKKGKKGASKLNIKANLAQLRDDKQKKFSKMSIQHTMNPINTDAISDAIAE